MEKFDVQHVAAGNDHISDDTNGVLALVNDEVATLKDLMSATALPGASLGSLELTYDGSDENPSKFDGTFNGVPGSYNCAATCTATADSDGELTALTGSGHLSLRI